MIVPKNIIINIRSECMKYLSYKKSSRLLPLTNQSHDLVNNFFITITNITDINWNTLFTLLSSLVKDKKAFKESSSVHFDEFILKVIQIIKDYDSTLQIDILWKHQDIMQVCYRKDFVGQIQRYKDYKDLALKGKIYKLIRKDRLQKILHIVWLFTTTSIVKKLDSNGKFLHNNILYTISNKKYANQEVTLFLVPAENKIYVTHDTNTIDEIRMDSNQKFIQLPINKSQNGFVYYILHCVLTDIENIRQVNFVSNLSDVLDNLPYESLKSTNHLYLFLFGSFREWLTSSFIPNAMATAFQYILQRPVGLMEQPSLTAQSFANTCVVIKQLITIIQNALNIKYIDVANRFILGTGAQTRNTSSTSGFIEFD